MAQTRDSKGRHRWHMGIAASLLTILPYATAEAAKYGEEQVAELVEIVQSEKAPEARRAAAARELEKTDVRTHLSVLRRLLREERSPDIRLASACTLAALGDRKSPKDLLLVTAYDGNRTASVSRCDVLIALGKLKDGAALFHLERALKSPAPEDEPLYHAEAGRALGALGSPEAVQTLLSMLRDGVPAARRACVSPLAEAARTIGHPFRSAAAAAVLQSARTDGDEGVALQAMGAVLWEGAGTPAFFPLLERDPDPKVRARAARAMDRHYLTAPRLQRLRAALLREQHPEVRAAMESTLASQRSGSCA